MANGASTNSSRVMARVRMLSVCGSYSLLALRVDPIASFPGSTAQRFLHFGKTRVGSLGSLVRII